MVSAAAALFLLSIIVWLGVVYLEGGRIGLPIEGLSPLSAARTRAGVRLYYGAFAAAGVAVVGIVLAAMVSQVSAAVLAAVPVLLGLSCILLGGGIAAMVWSLRPPKG